MSIFQRFLNHFVLYRIYKLISVTLMSNIFGNCLFQSKIKLVANNYILLIGIKCQF